MSTDGEHDASSDASDRDRVRRLEAALRARDELLAALAHELRSPLGVVTINGALLQRWAGPDADPEKIRGATDKIQRAARRMNEQLVEALDAVKADRGDLRVELAPHPVRELLARAHEAAAPAARQRGFELELRPVADDLRVACDEARVQQLLALLIDRALRTSPSTGRLTLGAAPAGDHVRVELAGADAAIAGDVELYARNAGTNLRLALARTIVEAHGGAITVEAATDRGAILRFTLPRR